jgi:hypothetical protein
MPVGDWDMSVFAPDGALAGSSGNGPNQLTLTNPAAGTYTVAAAPFAPLVGPAGNSYTQGPVRLPAVELAHLGGAVQRRLDDHRLQGVPEDGGHRVRAPRLGRRRLRPCRAERFGS